MLSRGNLYLASVIFHELAHQKVYVENDSAFNEAFAEPVALTGVRSWLKINGTEISTLEFANQQKKRLFC